MTEHRDDGRGDLRVGGWLPYPPDRAPGSADDDTSEQPPAYQPPGAYGWTDEDEPFDAPPARDEPPAAADGPAYGDPWRPATPASPFDAFGGTRGADPGYSPPAERAAPTGFDGEPVPPPAGFEGDREPAIGRFDGEPMPAPAGFDGERPTEQLLIPVQRAGSQDRTAGEGPAGRHDAPTAPSPYAGAGAAAGGVAAGAPARTGAPATVAGPGRTGGAPPGHTGGTVSRPAPPPAQRRSTPGANDVTQQLRMIPAAIAELPPVTLRGLPMFLAAVMALGAIAILVTMNLPSGKPSTPASRATSTPTLGMPTIAPVLPPAPTGAVPKPTAAATTAPSRTTAAKRTTSPSPVRVLLGALGTAEMSNYCQSQQAGGARLTESAQGPNAAIDNWVCTGEKRNKGFTIVPTSVCRWRYGGTAYAAYLDINDAYSWRCYR